MFIYHLEAHLKYLPLTHSILQHIEAGRGHAVISTVTVTEVTVRPWQMNRGDVARQYEVLLNNFPNLCLIDVTRRIARQGAQLRAKYNLRPADALQVATAWISGATAWISNDKKLRRVEPEIEVLILEDFVE